MTTVRNHRANAQPLANTETGNSSAVSSGDASRNGARIRLGSVDSYEPASSAMPGGCEIELRPMPGPIASTPDWRQQIIDLIQQLKDLLSGNGPVLRPEPEVPQFPSWPGTIGGELEPVDPELQARFTFSDPKNAEIFRDVIENPNFQYKIHPPPPSLHEAAQSGNQEWIDRHVDLMAQQIAQRIHDRSVFAKWDDGGESSSEPPQHLIDSARAALLAFVERAKTEPQEDAIDGAFEDLGINEDWATGSDSGSVYTSSGQYSTAEEAAAGFEEFSEELRRRAQGEVTD